VQQLERDRPAVPEIPGEVHRGHATAPQLALEHVAVAQGRSEFPFQDRCRKPLASPSAIAVRIAELALLISAAGMWSHLG